MKVVVILTARPSYAKLKTVIAALLARSVDVHILACASALLERYGRVVDVVRKDFPDVQIEECWSTYEGANLITSAKETGALIEGIADILSRLRPNTAVVCADRHEALGAVIAASFLHVPVVHLQGGERSGSIDDSVRDSITQLATIHCVSTERARYRVHGLTGDWENIHNTGCPSIDLAKQALNDPPVTVEELGGAGAPIDLLKPFVVVLQHPVTNECRYAGSQMEVTLAACQGIQTISFWPGEDAGADAASKVVRAHQAKIHTVRNLPPIRFLRLLSSASCLVGNSSAGIREASFLGCPVVNIGSRQSGRERGPNVVDVLHNEAQIGDAIDQQIVRGPYQSSTLYGTGDAGEKIAEVICGRGVARQGGRGEAGQGEEGEAGRGRAIWGL